MHEKEKAPTGARAGISMRAAELTVGLLVFLLGAVVVIGSYRLGAKWGDDGPQSGYFPFYVGLLMCISCLVTLVQVLVSGSGADEFFVRWGQLKLVLTVLIPALVYVLGVQYMGLYVASAIYITVFMVTLGNYTWFRSISVGLVVNASFFLMFEVWFQVPLFKGSLDPLRFLGY